MHNKQPNRTQHGSLKSSKTSQISLKCPPELRTLQKRHFSRQGGSLSTKTKSKIPTIPQSTTSENYTIFNPQVLPQLLSCADSSTTPSSHHTTAGSVLYISHMLPDPNGSAAGVRTMGVVRNLTKLGFQPIVLTPNKLHTLPTSLINVYNNLNIPITRCEVNDPTSGFETFIKALADGSYFPTQFRPFQHLQNQSQRVSFDQTTSDNLKLSMVIFDRYTIEEIFGIRLRAALPEKSPVLSIIDSQDLHFLRYSRENYLQSCINGNNPNISNDNSISQNSDINTHKPRVHPQTASNNHPLFATDPYTIFTALKSSNAYIQRELATYFRSDLVLTVSENEAKLLSLLGLPAPKSLFIPITYPDVPHITQAVQNRDHQRTSEQQRLMRSDFNLTQQTSSKTNPRADNVDMLELFHRPFSKRSDFVFIGTMRHHPNVECVEQLHDVYTPLIDSLNRQVNQGVPKAKNTSASLSSNLPEPALMGDQTNNPDSVASDVSNEIINESVQGGNNMIFSSIDQLQSRIIQLHSQLSALQSQKRPSIHIYGSHMTKTQDAMTIQPNENDIQLELQISSLQHQINQLSDVKLQHLARRDHSIHNHSTSANSAHLSNTDTANDDIPLPLPNSPSDTQPIKQTTVNLRQTKTLDRTSLNANFFQNRGPFVMRGTAKHAIQTLSRYKVLLTPLNFGAGIKGKVIDSFLAGGPVVGTPIAAEGLGIDYHMANSSDKITDQFRPNQFQCCQVRHPTKQSATTSTTNGNNQRCHEIYSLLQQQCDLYNGDLENLEKLHSNNLSAVSSAVSAPISPESLLHSQWPGVIHTDPTILSTSALLLNTCACEWHNQHTKIAPLLSQFRDEYALPILKSKLVELSFDEISNTSDCNASGVNMNLNELAIAPTLTISDKLTPSVNNLDQDRVKLKHNTSKLEGKREGDFIGQMLFHQYNNHQTYMGRYINMKNQYESLQNKVNYRGE